MCLVGLPRERLCLLGEGGEQVGERAVETLAAAASHAGCSTRSAGVLLSTLPHPGKRELLRSTRASGRRRWLVVWFELAILSFLTAGLSLG